MSVGMPELAPKEPDEPIWAPEFRWRHRVYGAVRHAYEHGYGKTSFGSGDLVSGRLESTRDVSQKGGWKSSPREDKGHPFYSVKLAVVPHSEVNAYTVSPYGDRLWYASGPALPSLATWHAIAYLNGLRTIDGGAYADLEKTEWATLRALGATAISRTIPNAPSVSVAQTLGELREGLPSIIGRSLKKGDLGGEYLNYQFGIAPTISDVQGYLETSRRAEEILAQWKRDSGRRVRRRYTFPAQEETYTVSGSGYPYVGATQLNAYLSQQGTITRTTKLRRNVWFSGAYRYYVPPSATRLLEKAREINRLYGVVPTAETAWELLPWSWLVDWNVNLGDVISNLSAFQRDDLVLTYGYIMSHARVEHEIVWRGPIRYGNAWQDTRIAATVYVDIKQRERASPYGLGWTGGSYSARQLAILAALGIASR